MWPRWTFTPYLMICPESYCTCVRPVRGRLNSISLRAWKSEWLPSLVPRPLLSWRRWIRWRWSARLSRVWIWRTCRVGARRRCCGSWRSGRVALDLSGVRRVVERLLDDRLELWRDVDGASGDVLDEGTGELRPGGSVPVLWAGVGAIVRPGSLGVMPTWTHSRQQGPHPLPIRLCCPWPRRRQRSTMCWSFLALCAIRNSLGADSELPRSVSGRTPWCA